jgi:hypothetical protein
MADHVRTELVTDALDTATRDGRIEPQAIFHSARGNTCLRIRRACQETRHSPARRAHRRLLEQCCGRIVQRRRQGRTRPDRLPRLGNTHGKTSPDTSIPAGFTPPGYRTPREAYNDYTTSDRQHELTIIIRPENAGPPKARIGPPAPGTSSTADDQASIKPRRTRKTTGVIITPGDTSPPMP